MKPNKSHSQTIFALVGLSAAILSATGCRYLLPAHGNSNERTGERTEMLFIAREDLDPQLGTNAADIKARTDLLNSYLKAFPEMKERAVTNEAGLVFAALAAPIAAAAVSYVFDYISQEIKAESELYEQQWQVSEYNSQFWRLKNTNPPALSHLSTSSSELNSIWTTNISGIEGLFANQPIPPRTNIILTVTGRESRIDTTLKKYLSAYVQDIYGFRVRRFIGGSKPELASELIVGFAPIEGQRMFMVKPLSYQCLKAKAKVLGKGSSWLALGLPWVLGKYPGNEIKTTVDVSIEADWMENQNPQQKTVAAFQIQLPNYNISENKLLKIGAGLPNTVVGVFGGIPVSTNSKGTPLSEEEEKWLPYLGLFKVKTLVTEKDVSNAKNKLIELQNQVDREKTNAVNKVEAFFKN